MTARPHLFERIREHLHASLNGYVDPHALDGGLDSYVGPPGLGALAGPLGALAVAADAYQRD